MLNENSLQHCYVTGVNVRNVRGKMFSCIFLAVLIQQSLSQSLDYVCTQSGEVKILKSGIEQYQWMYASGVRDKSDSQPCTVSGANDTSAGYGIKFIISGCDLMSVIHVTITTAREDKNIIGGKESVGFEIKCNGIYEGGENKSLVQTVLSKDKVFIERHQEMVDEKMEIQSREGTKLNETTIVLIGNELRVLISTSINFSFSIISCDAQSKNAHDKKLLIQNGNAEDSSLMTTFSNKSDSKRNIKEATMYAFHFVNSDYLQLTCVIFICRIRDATCKHNTDRQKRNTQGEGDSFSPLEQSLEAKFVVVDSEGSRTIGTSGTKPINVLFFPHLVVIALAVWRLMTDFDEYFRR